MKFFLIGLVFLVQCSFVHKENRVLTNEMDEYIQPDSTTSKILLSPVGICVGTISLLTDNFIVHPVRVIPRSLEKTYEAVWDKPQGGVIRQSFLFVPKLILTPFAFLFNWLIYASFGKFGSDGKLN